MPEDLRERFLWVLREGGTAIDYAAALRAIEQDAQGDA
jgi:hypothetical protein